MSAPKSLSVSEVDIVLELLRDQQKALGETGPQRVVFAIYRLTTIGTLVAFALLAGQYVVFRIGGGDPLALDRIWRASPGWSLGIFLVLIVASVVSLVVMLVQKRQYRSGLRLLEQFGLKGAVDEPWHRRATEASAGNFASAMGCLLGGLIGIVPLLALPVLALINRFRTMPWNMADLSLTTVLFATPGILLISLHFMRRARMRQALMADLGELERLVKSKKEDADDSDERIELDPTLHRRLSRFEREQMHLQRSAAIDASLRSEQARELSYAILKSARSLEQASELGMPAILNTESILASLSKDPHPSGAEALSDGLWRLRTQGLEIHYDVNEKKRQVRVHRVESLEPGGPLGSGGVDA